MRKRSSDEARMLFFLLGVLGICIWMFWASRQAANRPADAITVKQVVGSGNWVLALRFPVFAEHQEEIRVGEGSPQRQNELRRGGVGSYNFKLIHPTPAQWQLVTTLRQDWCQDTPMFRAPEEDEPFFDLGFRCESAWDTRRIKIPVDELPPELAQLIEMVPSPTCDDPFCGWQNPYP